LNKKTATAVARTLIKYKYPNPKSNFWLFYVDKSVIDVIISDFNLLYSYKWAIVLLYRICKVFKFIWNVIGCKTSKSNAKLFLVIEIYQHCRSQMLAIVRHISKSDSIIKVSANICWQSFLQMMKEEFAFIFILNLEST
jgi:hypothetical protein